MKCFHRTLVFDFGSVNTVVCDEDGNVLFDEPTVIAELYCQNGKLLIGHKASMAPEIGHCKFFIRPIVRGYVNDYDAFETFVKAVVKKLVHFPRIWLKTVVIAIPDDLFGDKNASACDRAFFEPFRKMGVKDIRTMHKSIAVFLGTKYIVNTKL